MLLCVQRCRPTTDKQACVSHYVPTQLASHAPQTFPLVDTSVRGSVSQSLIMGMLCDIVLVVLEINGNINGNLFQTSPAVSWAVYSDWRLRFLNYALQVSWFFFFLPPGREFYAPLFLTILQVKLIVNWLLCFDQLSKNLIIAMAHTAIGKHKQTGCPARLAPFLCELKYCLLFTKWFMKLFGSLLRPVATGGKQEGITLSSLVVWTRMSNQKCLKVKWPNGLVNIELITLGKRAIGWLKHWTNMNPHN